MRGEHAGTLSTAAITYGSSPHARGARLRAQEGGHRERLIPACAGSTRTSTTSGMRSWAHPRMRGEHADQYSVPSSRVGSSPHARGARAGPRRPGRIGRLIPACAGSTPAPSDRRSRPPAHPRMRGEHADRAEAADGEGGSSPHARGAHTALAVHGRGLRLIPACAGSTRTGRHMSRASTAHPRMRGEHPQPGDVEPEAPGSSPHARGAPHDGGAGPFSRRLIPACAGSTNGGPLSTFPSAAHPRMRGEHSAKRRNSPPWLGSSPHARGARASSWP